ncbi:hypothetical protein GGTG_06656 [Gaeumannomyces tritici R3-111a-1]|uniref:Uncharacterized protein n=1 Tax=Gaeumannomyces tritici (strain R3-111a-1) TaxID=644352 RepID=J3NZF7_GAET3|nr:hypothetical protein GGTG_06656 [Gaeumannomyces tritici R3-111a-1]EJT76740.1 hypothetical protein GGTG_06656 [Gaeumannomyces tritici R3-111a-1]
MSSDFPTIFYGAEQRAQSAGVPDQPRISMCWAYWCCRGARDPPLCFPTHNSTFQRGSRRMSWRLWPGPLQLAPFWRLDKLPAGAPGGLVELAQTAFLVAGGGRGRASWFVCNGTAEHTFIQHHQTKKSAKPNNALGNLGVQDAGERFDLTAEYRCHSDVFDLSFMAAVASRRSSSR